MITSDYVAMRFDATEGWTCVIDGPEGAGALRGRTWTFDFAKGAKSIGLVPADISLLGQPREIRLRLRGSSRGHPLRLRMVTHFMTFERTLGPVEGDGPHEIVLPAPPGEGWRWFGGENDGKIHGPLRITGLFLDAAGEGGAGRLEMVDVRVRSRCPAERTSVLTAELRSTPPAPRFLGVVRSQAPRPFDARLRCVIRDWNGRTVGRHSRTVRVSSSQPAELAVPVPAGDHVFLEAEFNCQAAGQGIPVASACYTASVPAGGSDQLDPGSPFGMGVYLYRYGDPELMDRAARIARDIGVKWSREEFLWSVIEPRKGQFDWSFYDRVVATAKRHGISVYGLLDYWSDWTHPYTPHGIEDYCRYVRAVVERYKSDIHHWEVWNEPNIFFWQGPKDMYADLLKAAYRTIKQADSTAQVAGCSTSGIDLDFVRRVMKLGGPFDILTVHPYRDELLDRPFIQELKQAAAETKQPDGQVRPVWITEMGWGTHMPHNAAKSGTFASPRQQACLLARTYVDALASGVTPNISWYDFRNDGTNLLEWEHNLGIIMQDFQPKPACRAYATLTTMLAGRQVQEELKLGEDVLAFRFVKPGGREPVIVLWSVKKPQTVSLPVAGPAVLTNLMGQTHNLPVEHGKAKVDLAPGVPVFVGSGGRGSATMPATARASAGTLGSEDYRRELVLSARTELRADQDLSRLTPSTKLPYAFENTASLAVGWRITGEKAYLERCNKGIDLWLASLDANGLYPHLSRSIHSRVPVYLRYLSWWLDRPELGKVADRHLMAEIDHLERTAWSKDPKVVLFAVEYGQAKDGYPITSKPTSDPNQNADIAHGFALALSDPASTFHGASRPVANRKWYPGKTYADVAREIIRNELAAVYALQNGDGSLRLQESYQQCQTNYGAYALLHLAAIAASTHDAQVRQHLLAGAKWLQTLSGERPPYSVRVWPDKGDPDRIAMGDWFARLMVMGAVGLDTTSFRDRGYAHKLPTDGGWCGDKATWDDHALYLCWILPAYYAGVPAEAYAGTTRPFVLDPPARPAATSQPARRARTNAAQDAFASGCGEWYGLFNLPSAQHRKGKTYVVYPDKGQKPVAVCYDHALGKWSDPVVISSKSLGSDSHGNPAMLVDRKGFLHVFHGCHGGPMRYARSKRPEDAFAWAEQPDPAPHATYPQVMQMANGRIDLFYRAGVHTDDWVYRTSDDGGEKWSAETAIIDGVPPREAWYANFAKGPEDTVHVGFVWKDDSNELKAPGPEYVHRYDVFYMRRDSKGSWLSASGERLTLPLSRADANRLCKVYDSQSRQEFTGGCSVGVNKEGNACLLFRAAAKYGTTVYQHKFAAWNGKAWAVSDVGPAVDCGFADFPRDDNFLLQVLPSGQLKAFVVNIMAGKPVRTALEQWDGSDGGRKWKRRRTIFRSTDYPAAYLLIAPKLVVDAHPDAWLVFGLRRRYLFGDAGFLGR